MIAEEKKALDLIKKHVGRDVFDYQFVRSCSYYGFMDYYLTWSKNDEKMTTSADFDVTMTLAKYDQSRDNKKKQFILLLIIL